jgi:hypothetical protein
VWQGVNWISDEHLSLGDEIAHSLSGGRSYIMAAERRSLVACPDGPFVGNQSFCEQQPLCTARHKKTSDAFANAADSLLSGTGLPTVFYFTSQLVVGPLRPETKWREASHLSAPRSRVAFNSNVRLCLPSNIASLWRSSRQAGNLAEWHRLLTEHTEGIGAESQRYA